MPLAVETSPQTFLLSLPKAIQVSCRTAASVKNIDEVVSLVDEPKIFKLQKVDKDATYKVVGRILLRMVKDMNLPNGLSDGNIRSIAKRLTEDENVRYWLTLADISLLCRQIAEGYYGKTYGHFGLAEFDECLVKYCNERTECHRVNNSKTVVDVNVLHENLGYTIDEEGRLKVPDELQGVQKKRPLRYLYDSKGNVTGENPKYWAHVRQKDEKSKEEMDEINQKNKVLELANQFMKEQKIGYVEAYKKAYIAIYETETILQER